jgi:hypothetical protein
MKKERKDTTVNISDVTSYNMKILCAVRGIQQKEFVDMMVRKEMEKQGLKYAVVIPE